MTQYIMKLKNGDKEILRNEKELIEFLKFFELGKEVVYAGVIK